MVIKIILRVAAISLIIALILGVTGCKPQDPKSAMLAYLKNKYHQEFIVKSFSSRNWAYKYDLIAACPKDKEDQIFNVRAIKKIIGGYDCEDNYFEFIIQDDYEKVISDIVKEHFTDFKVYMRYSEGMHAAGLTYGVKVEDIYKYDKNFMINILIFVKKDNTKNKDLDIILEQIATKMIEKKLMGGILLFPTLNDKFELLTRNIVNEVLGTERYNEWFELHKEIIISNKLKIHK